MTEVTLVPPNHPIAQSHGHWTVSSTDVRVNYCGDNLRCCDAINLLIGQPIKESDNQKIAQQPVRELGERVTLEPAFKKMLEQSSSRVAILSQSASRANTVYLTLITKRETVRLKFENVEQGSLGPTVTRALHNFKGNSKIVIIDNIGKGVISETLSVENIVNKGNASVIGSWNYVIHPRNIHDSINALGNYTGRIGSKKGFLAKVKDTAQPLVGNQFVPNAAEKVKADYGRQIVLNLNQGKELRTILNIHDARMCFFKDNPFTISRLNFSGMPVSQILDILPDVEDLKTVEINNPCFESDDFDYLLDGLQGTETVKTFSLSNANLEDQDIQSLSEHEQFMEGLESLTLNSCGLIDFDIEVLAHNPFTKENTGLSQLGNLDLQNNYIGDKGFVTLCKSLPQKSKNIQFQLNLRNNHISDIGIIDGVKYLAEQSSLFPILDLSGNTQIGEEGIRALIQHNEDQGTFYSLTLPNNGLSTEFLKELEPLIQDVDKRQLVFAEPKKD